MLEPFLKNPCRDDPWILVLPMIWMNMVNDLRSFPSIRENYQFWFYQYPTSQPFWFSAASFQFAEYLSQSRSQKQHRQPQYRPNRAQYVVYFH